jgi:hypothetical protein
MAPCTPQVLDPQTLPFDATRWYNATPSKKQPDKHGFVDQVWDGDGVLTYKRIGKNGGDTAVPQLERPRDWSGTRVTQVAAPFWPAVEKQWAALNRGAAGDTWRGTRRVVLVQVGTWYMILGGGRHCHHRQELCGVRGNKLMKTYNTEARHAMRAFDAWGAAHTDSPLQLYVASVATGGKPFRGGLKSLVVSAGSKRLRFFDLAVLAGALPGERVRGHPSLLLSNWIFNTLITQAFNTASATGCGEQQYVQFGQFCKAKAMIANCRGCKVWSDPQRITCSYRITT